MTGKIEKISIIVPVYNENVFIKKLLERLYKADICGLEKEIIVVNDGSTDGTSEILDEAQEMGYILLHHEKNMGKGAGIRTALAKVSGDIVVIQDADLEYDPDEIKELVRPILDNRADIVYGSRLIGYKPHRVLYFWHYVGNKFITLVSNIFSNLNLTDVETCYKAFTTQVVKNMDIKENGFGFENEFTMKAARTKYRFYEVGISYAGRTYEDGKKLVALPTGLRALWCIIRYRFFD